MTTDLLNEMPTRMVIEPPLQTVRVSDVFRLSVEKYHEMIRRDILTSDDRVELLDGVLVSAMSKKPPHSNATSILLRRLGRLFSLDWTIRGQEPITLSLSEPEPDITVARGEEGSFSDRHPVPSEIEFVVEVAESSLDRDRIDKQAIYARDSVKQYWVVNLVDEIVHVYSDPTGPSKTPRYRTRNDFGRGSELPIVVDGKSVGVISVDDILR